MLLLQDRVAFEDAHDLRDMVPLSPWGLTLQPQLSLVDLRFCQYLIDVRDIQLGHQVHDLVHIALNCLIAGTLATREQCNYFLFQLDAFGVGALQHLGPVIHSLTRGHFPQAFDG